MVGHTTSPKDAKFHHSNRIRGILMHDLRLMFPLINSLPTHLNLLYWQSRLDEITPP